MTRIRPQSLLYALSALVIALDQVAKYLVRTRLAWGETWVPLPAVRSVFDITHTTNTGAAFGMFPSGGTLFTIVAVLVIGAIVYYSRSLAPGQWVVGVALGLQLGGAIGNLIDRIVFGPVTDFLHVHNFPVFNLADSSISVGVAVLALLLLFESRQGRAEAPEDVAAEPDPSR